MIMPIPSSSLATPQGMKRLNIPPGREITAPSTSISGSRDPRSIISSSLTLGAMPWSLENAIVVDSPIKIWVGDVISPINPALGSQET